MAFATTRYLIINSILLVLLSNFLSQVSGSGIFEIRINSFENFRGVDATGACCAEPGFHYDSDDDEGNILIQSEALDNDASINVLGDLSYVDSPRRSRTDKNIHSTPHKCMAGQCSTYFTVCLKHYQQQTSQAQQLAQGIADDKFKSRNSRDLRDSTDDRLVDFVQSEVREDYKQGTVKQISKRAVSSSNRRSASTPANSCTFGSFMTATLGGNSFYNHDHVYALPFSFTWPGTFSLVIEAWHNSSASSNTHKHRPRQQDQNDHMTDEAKLIARLEAHKATPVLVADGRWNQDTHVGVHTKLKYAYRVVCDRHYYGRSCANLCRPRSDKFGHYVCGRNGQKICEQGWTGPYCTQAICARGCHADHGFCDTPGECKCRLGYKGKYCEDCIRYPGCLHGTCHQPWQCNCKHGWGGLFCNQDLNYCTNHKPCKNGGTCANSGQGSFTCSCPKGFLGANCEIEIAKCDPSLCLNGGTCRLNGNSLNYTCECLPGFLGERCQTNTFSCADKPCYNGSTCLDLLDGGYKCLCQPGWSGVMCHITKSKCPQNDCKNGGQCVLTKEVIGDKLKNSSKCMCPTGFTGPKCRLDVNRTVANSYYANTSNSSSYQELFSEDGGSNKIWARDAETNLGLASIVQGEIDSDGGNCDINPCLNGGQCFERDSYTFVCRCKSGFRGSLCQVDVPDCGAQPCANGGTCADLINDYTCTCPPGFEGKDCTINVDDCRLATDLYVRGTVSEPPCTNNGTCVDRINGYACQCPHNFYGDKCQFSAGSIVKISGQMWGGLKEAARGGDLLAVQQVLRNDKLLNRDLDQFDFTADGRLKLARMGEQPAVFDINEATNAALRQSSASGGEGTLSSSSATATSTVANILTKTEMIMIICLSISFVTVTLAIIGILCVYKRKFFTSNSGSPPDDEEPPTHFRNGGRHHQGNQHHHKALSSPNLFYDGRKNSSRSQQRSGTSTNSRKLGGTGLPRTDLRIPSTIEETSETNNNNYPYQYSTDVSVISRAGTNPRLFYGNKTLQQLSGLSEDEYYRTLTKLGPQEIYNRIKNQSNSNRLTATTHCYGSDLTSDYDTSHYDLYAQARDPPGIHKPNNIAAVTSSNKDLFGDKGINNPNIHEDEDSNSRSELGSLVSDNNLWQSQSSHPPKMIPNEIDDDGYYSKASPASKNNPPTYDQSQGSTVINSAENKNLINAMINSNYKNNQNQQMLNQQTRQSPGCQLSAHNAGSANNAPAIDYEAIYNEPKRPSIINAKNQILSRLHANASSNKGNSSLNGSGINSQLTQCLINSSSTQYIPQDDVSPPSSSCSPKPKGCSTSDTATESDDYVTHEAINQALEQRAVKYPTSLKAYIKADNSTTIQGEEDFLSVV